MAIIALHDQMNSDMLVIPGLFIDQYLLSASGTDVKVYLYLQRAMQLGSAISLSVLADMLELTEKELLRSLSHWEQEGLMRLSFSSDHSLTAIAFLPVSPREEAVSVPSSDSFGRLAGRKGATQLSIPAPVLEAVVSAHQEAPVKRAASAVPAEQESEKKEASRQPEEEAALLQAQSALPERAGGKTALPSDSPAGRETPAAAAAALSPEDIASLDSDPAYSLYLLAWQQYFPLPFTYTDTERIGYWYLRFNRSGDLMDYLIDYCASNGHANTRYMEKVAGEWYAKGYRTVEEARTNTQLDSQASYAVMKAFGLYNQKPAPAQFTYIQKWVHTYGFSADMLVLACNRTIEKLQKPDFKYTDGILKSWMQSGAMTPEAVALQDEEHKKNRQAASDSARQSRKKDAPPQNTRSYNNFSQRNMDYDKLLLSGH